MKIIAAMSLREPLYPFATRTSLPVKAAAVICTVAVVIFFFMPRSISLANSRHDITDAAPRLLK